MILPSDSPDAEIVLAHDTGKQAALGRVLVALSAVAWSTAGIFTKGVEADVWTVLLAEGVLRIRAAEAALLGALEVPLAPLWSWLILSEIPRMPTVAGGAVVLVTLAWYLRRETRVRS